MLVSGELDESPCPSPTPPPKPKPNFRQRKVRKTGLSTVELKKMIPELNDLGESNKRSPKPRSVEGGVSPVLCQMFCFVGTVNVE